MICDVISHMLLKKGAHTSIVRQVYKMVLGWFTYCGLRGKQGGGGGGGANNEIYTCSP
jgi:hypothetical protein